MKNKVYTLFTLIILCFAAFFFQSCSDEKYTVWTETDYYSDWVNAGGTAISAMMQSTDGMKQPSRNGLLEMALGSKKQRGKQHGCHWLIME